MPKASPKSHRSPRKKRRGNPPPGSAVRPPEPRRARPAIRSAAGGRLWLYGRHAVEAALNNARRTCHQLLATDEALGRLNPDLDMRGVDVRRIDRADLDARFGDGVVHQGLALAVAPLPKITLQKACMSTGGTGRDMVLVLDQINDPQNLGAILRSAVAFDARAVIVPARRSADLGGAVAKAASGALDLIPIVEVTNLASALDDLRDLGYWRVALDGGAERTVDTAPAFDQIALVLGAEGAGVRRLVAERCDLTLRLPIATAMESLNVSVAGGIALYALTRGKPG